MNPQVNYPSLSLGTSPYTVVYISEQVQRELNRELKTVHHELETVNTGCVRSVISTKNPLIDIHYNRNPLAGPDPKHSVPFTLQVEDHCIVFTASLTHPFVKDFHAHTLPCTNEVYKKLAYNVNPPTYQHTRDARVDFTQPYTKVLARIHCSYAINGMDKTMRFLAHDAVELACFLGLFLSLYGFADAVRDRLNASLQDNA
jgi:hypothetical protein